MRRQTKKKIFKLLLLLLLIDVGPTNSFWHNTET